MDRTNAYSQFGNRSRRGNSYVRYAFSGRRPIGGLTLIGYGFFARMGARSAAGGKAGHRA